MSKRLIPTYNAFGEEDGVAVRWDGTAATYKFLTTWTDYRVRVSGDTLILQEPGRTAVVEEGDYIVKYGGWFHRDSPNRFSESHAA